jgi:hypothetical protein
MDAALSKALQDDNGKTAVSDAAIARCRKRAKAMLTDLRKYNPKQAAMVLDPSPHISGLCPRRAGKSYAGAAAALITGEAKPGSISLIISLNLKQLRRLYWKGGPSGLYTFDKKFKLGLEFNSTYLRWEHENGSIGYLLGAEDDEQLEVIRGMEADLYLIDECKSFAPNKLDTLIDDIIDPQRTSRDGRLILIGTPGFVASGPFYQATCPEMADKEGKPYLVPAGTKDPFGRTPDDDLLWSCHTWTLEENTAKPKQWTDGLKKKRSKRWADDHPTWLREYMGRWTVGGEGLVFRYAEEKKTGRVTWEPQITPENPSGLPAEGAPWRLIGGLDMGYEAPTAFVLAAYSPRLRQLRHVKDWSARHMLVPDIADMIHEAQAKYGLIEKIFADAGNLGVTIVETLARQYGLPMERAEKREKLDYIELCNGALSRHEILLIENTPLEHQMMMLAWDMKDDDEKIDLARRGKLREDPNIPNDSTDAFLYLYRGSLHHFGVPSEEAPLVPGSPEAVKAWERDQLEKARRTLRKADEQKFGGSAIKRAPGFARRAMEKTCQIPSTPSRHSTLTSFR